MNFTTETNHTDAEPESEREAAMRDAYEEDLENDRLRDLALADEAKARYEQGLPVAQGDGADCPF